MVYVTHDQTEAMVAADRIALMRATVLRQVCLADSRDYLIDLGQRRIRVFTPPIEDHGVGSTVHLDVAVEACRIVPGTNLRRVLRSRAADLIGLLIAGLSAV